MTGLRALLEADPYGDPLEIDWDKAWRLHAGRLKQASLEREAFEDEAEALLHRIADVLAGRVPTPDAELRERADRLGLWWHLKVDPRSLDPRDRLATVPEMARIAQDIAPAAGMDAPDRFLGPWADVLDARDEAHRHVLHTALAADCFIPEDGDKWGRSPFVQWVRRKPHPGLDEREWFRAVEHAPQGAWRILEKAPEGWVLEDLIGIGPRAQPPGRVRVEHPATVDGGGAVGDLLLARVAPTEEGWVAALPFALRGCPERPTLRSWIMVEAILWRLHDKLRSVDDLLRDRPHVVVRRAHEWSWVRRRASGT